METFSELYEDAPVPYITFDHQGLIHALNAQARRLLGLEMSHAVGLPLRSCVTRADRGEVSVHLARLLADGRANNEVRLRSDGDETTVRLESRRTARDPNLYWSALFDVSLQRRSQSEHTRLEDAERSAREAISIKDRFIAVLSHELRAPLAPVLVAISSLEAAHEQPAKVARLCEIIRRNVLREARLIDDLLDLSRVTSGKVGLQYETVDLHAIACESLEMLSAEARDRRLTLTIELEAARHQVSGDPSRLRQVFNNLLKNAVKFTPEDGTIALRSWNHGDKLAVEVSDNGVGIPAEALPRIFDSFEQAHGSASRGGLGLGLAIARGMIELHGGRIQAHSPGPGLGARFVVELRALAAEAEAELPPPRAPRRPPRRAFRDAEILVVEDEPDLAETLVTVLEAEGYRVRTVATAGAALDANIDNVDLVISDIGLPDLDGRALLGKLKSKRDVKAIALSGYGTEADVQASEAAGFDRHLTKPVEMNVLLGAVDRACADL
jgi:PAS domain S-box-containing protein